MISQIKNIWQLQNGQENISMAAQMQPLPSIDRSSLALHIVRNVITLNNTSNRLIDSRMKYILTFSMTQILIYHTKCAICTAQLCNSIGWSTPLDKYETVTNPTSNDVNCVFWKKTMEDNTCSHSTFKSKSIAFKLMNCNLQTRWP